MKRCSRYVREPKVKPHERASSPEADAKRKAGKKKKASARRAVQRENRRGLISGELLSPAARAYDPQPRGYDLIGLGLMFVGLVLFERLPEESKERIRRAILDGRFDPPGLFSSPFSSSPFPYDREQMTDPFDEDGGEWPETLPAAE